MRFPHIGGDADRACLELRSGTSTSETDTTVPRRCGLIDARCEVLYRGRLTAVLPEAVRLLVVEADWSVLVRDDSGGCKPLNRIRREFRPQAV